MAILTTIIHCSKGCSKGNDLNWAAVKEFKLTWYNKGNPIIYSIPHYGKLISAPQEQPSKGYPLAEKVQYPERP